MWPYLFWYACDWDLSIYPICRPLSMCEFDATSKPNNIIYLRCRVSPAISTTYAVDSLLTFDSLTPHACRAIIYIWGQKWNESSQSSLRRSFPVLDSASMAHGGGGCCSASAPACLARSVMCWPLYIFFSSRTETMTRETEERIYDALGAVMWTAMLIMLMAY